MHTAVMLALTDLREGGNRSTLVNSNSQGNYQLLILVGAQEVVDHLALFVPQVRTARNHLGRSRSLFPLCRMTPGITL